MRAFRYYILAAALALGLTAAAQEQPLLYGEQLPPASQAIRARMDEIRKVRPTVGLVLSGGGAKGAAHVGVIRYLEEMGIPVDLVTGTSMGGLVGGLYALGYPAGEMEIVIRGMDWDMALSDRISRDYMYYTDKTYRDHYALTTTFHYRTERRRRRAADVRPMGAGLLGGRLSGLNFGQNVNNVLSSLTVGYQDSLRFVDLPVPFACVATDMVSGQAKVWDEGKIVTAMRSTMSIPGMFAPVITEDKMILMDGGMRNNYPVDIAKQLGADIVIGVTLSEGYMDFEDMNNLLDMVSQGIDMLGRESYEKNRDLADITIRPDISGYNMLSFSPRAIDDLIRRGYEAAAASKDALLGIRQLVGEASSRSRVQKAVNIGMQRVRIDSLEITGVDARDERYLRKLIRKDLQETMDKSSIDNLVSTLYGTRAFDYIYYELPGESEPYRLRLTMKQGPIHRLGLGVRFDSEELMSALLNVGLNTGSFRGSALDVESKVGTNPYMGLHYYMRTTSGSAFNLTARYRYVDRNQLSIGASNYKAVFHEVRTEAYLSRYKMRNFDFKVGARDEYFNVTSVMSDKPFEGFADDMQRVHYPAAFASLRWDTFDDGYFPTRGYQTGLDYDMVFKGFEFEGLRFHSLQFQWRFAKSVGALTVMPSLNLRLVHGDDIPFQYANMVGGQMPGRYLDHQIAFIGISHAAITRDFVGVARLDARVRLARNHYLTAIGNWAADADIPNQAVDPEKIGYDTEDIQSSGGGISKLYEQSQLKGFSGYGLRYDFRSPFGPIGITVSWSDRTRRAGFYLSAGYNF